MVTTNFISAFLGADQPITSSATLATITGFSAPMVANQAYGFDAHIYFNLAGIISGVKFGLSTPSPTNSNYAIEVVNGTGLSLVAFGLAAQVASALATTGLHLARFAGVIENGANAGNLAIQFAQNTSDGSAITAKRGSYSLGFWLASRPQHRRLMSYFG
jgi:hypothetical protein